LACQCAALLNMSEHVWMQYNCVSRSGVNRSSNQKFHHNLHLL